MGYGLVTRPGKRLQKTSFSSKTRKKKDHQREEGKKAKKAKGKPDVTHEENVTEKNQSDLSSYKEATADKAIDTSIAPGARWRSTRRLRHRAVVWER